MLKNSISNSISGTKNPAATGFNSARRPGQWPPKGQTMFLLALPLALIVGCASNPGRAGWTDASYTRFPAPMHSPGTLREQANVAVGHEIFDLFMSMTNADFDLTAVSNNGLVTLGGSNLAGTGRQSDVNQIWALPGVTQVQDQQGDDMIQTAVTKTIAVR